MKYAKSIGIEDTKIRYALWQQMEKNNYNFSSCQELLNLVLDIKKDDKCMKCKNKEKKRSLHALWTHDILLDLYKRHLFLLVVHSKLVRNNPRQTMVIAQELKTCFCSSSEKHQSRKLMKLISNKLFLMKPESLKVLWFYF